MDKERLLDSLKAVFESMEGPGRAGDEYAYEWLFEVWAQVVPEDIRKSVGDKLTTTWCPGEE